MTEYRRRVRQLIEARAEIKKLRTALQALVDVTDEHNTREVQEALAKAKDALK